MTSDQMNGFDRMVIDALQAARNAKVEVDPPVENLPSDETVDILLSRTPSNELALSNPLSDPASAKQLDNVPPPRFGIPYDPSKVTGPVSKEQQLYLVGRLWLQGYTFYEIADYLKLPVATVQSYVAENREGFLKVQDAELQELAAERVAGFNMVKNAAWEQYALTPNSRWLQVIMRAEELAGKIQGVLSEKVHMRAEVIHKLYDFSDDAYVLAERRHATQMEALNNVNNGR
jgi:hypothetical protein